ISKNCYYVKQQQPGIRGGTKAPKPVTFITVWKPARPGGEIDPREMGTAPRCRPSATSALSIRPVRWLGSAGTAALARRRRGRSPRGRRGCAPYPSHGAFCRRRALDREHQAVSALADHCMLSCFSAPTRKLTARLDAKETTSMTIDVATGIVR